MATYTTAQVAKRFGIHPNTVRLYERMGLISQAQRRPNGYRTFTDLHLAQLSVVRTALTVPVLQNGLRDQAFKIIKHSAACDFDSAIRETDAYIRQAVCEQDNAQEALNLAGALLQGDEAPGEAVYLTRKQTADRLGISIDTLRNWELNNLFCVKRRQNGYRVYTNEDLRRLKIIRALRCANYSLSAILRMLSAVSRDPGADIRDVIDTPRNDEDIISVCDKLLSSLWQAELNARSLRSQLKGMREKFPNVTL